MSTAGRLSEDQRTRPGQAPPLVAPCYGRSTVAELLPAIAARLGVPGYQDVLGLSSAGRYLLVMVDGLGWHQLHQAGDVAPFLSGLLDSSLSLTAGVPSTTATSLASLGTGLPPGRHGIVGFVSRVPGSGELLNALSWNRDPNPRHHQAQPTVFEQITDAGRAARSVSPRHFARSGLTEATQRGADFIGYPDQIADAERVELIIDALTRSPRNVVYAYERDVDHAGHGHGVGSQQWQQALARVDRRCRMLVERLPGDATMIVTADHGMVNVDPGHRMVIEDEPDLMTGVDAVAGEARFRHLYVDHADPREVAACWSDRLGEWAWVRSRDHAIAEGWFGPVNSEVIERYGHVLVAMRGDWAVMTRTHPREMGLVGMHGSLTPAEMRIPLLTC